MIDTEKEINEIILHAETWLKAQSMIRSLCQKVREDAILEAAKIASNHDHSKFCTLNHCGGYGSTPTMCDIRIQFEISEEIENILSLKQAGKEK